MSKPQTIKIDEVEYVRKDSLPPAEGDIKIVVLDRGFVYIGRVDMTEKDFVIVRDTKNIRVWGTTKGLGELVNGPTKATILDDVGTLKAPLRALISLIDVDQEKWKCI